ncbi:MAG TPA: class I SAM-dependent methyltransferase [Rhizomicrobium sp.]
MPDHLFDDAQLAALYDAFCAGRADFAFYLPLVMAAPAVLDVGCGTGELLHRARELGHAGRLVGLDPAAGMLAQARKRGDIEWVLGDLSTARWTNAFDLVVMTGHAFQVFLEDDELRAALGAIRRALTPTGRFAFETRNPLRREWENWTPDRIGKVAAPDGTSVAMSRKVEAVEGDRVSFSHTFTSPAWREPQTSRSTLRFLSVEALAAFLAQADLKIEQQFGDWNGEPLAPTSPEIITVARRG